MLRFAVAVFALIVVPGAVQAQLACCYKVTRIDARAGVVSASDSATGAALQFQVRDRLLLSRLRVDQRIWVDLAGRRVGLDARQVCCAIIGTPTTPSPAVAARPAAPSPAPSPVITGPVAQAVISTNLPSISYGPPRPATRRTKPIARFETATITAAVSGRAASGSVLHLRGLKAIEQAPGLPDDARRLLVMAVRRVPRDQSDHYVVNTELARQWFAEHDVPDDIKATEPDEKKCDNWYDSWDCASQAVSDEWERAFDHAVKEWDRATGRLADVWETTQSCFSERTLTLPGIPVSFGISPSMSVDLTPTGSRGGAGGSVSGRVGLAVPMNADFTARLELFYIPCLPFAVRPKALSADGLLTVAQRLDGTVSATGAFRKTFTIPPTGGPVIPIQVYPIIIAGVPVSEVDVSAYIEGNIEVSAVGRASGRFQLENSHPTRFDFSCHGGGCSATSKNVPSPTTTSQGVTIDGRVAVKPAVYTALQLNFNYEALSARAGPQPYLLGVASGCGAVTATQPAGGTPTNQTSFALTGDLDWGVELRAEALVMRNRVGQPYVKRVLPDRHIWFRDLAPGGSTGLAANVTGPAQAEVGKPVLYRIRMPTCYPYPDRVRYRIGWTGPASAAAPTGCTWQAGSGTCQFDPTRDLVVSVTWTAAGNHMLTVAPSGDVHGRVFSPAPPSTQLSVTVAGASP